ncbi:unnamed protein product, partial [Rangifer tarandus platyrhynchus]
GAQKSSRRWRLSRMRRRPSGPRRPSPPWRMVTQRPRHPTARPSALSSCLSTPRMTRLAKPQC